MAAIFIPQANLSASPSLSFRPFATSLSLSSCSTSISLPKPKLFSPLKSAPLRRSSSSRAAAPPRGVNNETKGDDLDKKIQEGIMTAMEVCAGNETSEECIVEWDAVEEMSAAKADKRARQKQVKDPLEEYCKDNPETDECRVYED